VSLTAVLTAGRHTCHQIMEVRKWISSQVTDRQHRARPSSFEASSSRNAAPVMRSSAANSSVSVPASLRELCGDQAGPAAAPVPRLTSLHGMPDCVSKAACRSRRYLCCLFESEYLCVGSDCVRRRPGAQDDIAPWNARPRLERRLREQAASLVDIRV